MRVIVPPVNGVRAKAYPGTTGILLAFNVASGKRKALLGFAIERKIVKGAGKDPGVWKWLQGAMDFPGLLSAPGALVDTKDAPIQRFRWSDYTVHPATDYVYRVHPCYGSPGALKLEDGPEIPVSTLDPKAGEFVIFNRAAAASQAFARRFPKSAIDLYRAKLGKKKLSTVTLPPEAYTWLSRGLLEAILGFLGEAGGGDALDIAMYEYELEAIREAVRAAALRGAEVRILYHSKSASDPQTRENRAGLRTPKLPAATVTLIPRKPDNLMHDKFVILSRIGGGTRTPLAVLSGSTNFTENGVYRQANVVHISRDPSTAADYLDQFERMAATAQEPTATRAQVTAENPIRHGVPRFVGFSPRTGAADLAEFVNVIDEAKHDVMFTTVFAQISPGILKALLGKPHDDVLRIGVQNTATRIVGVHKDRTALFATPAMIPDGIEGWLKESLAGQKGTIYIHTKIIVAEFTTDAPTVISGSHNFTKPASDANDENFMILRSAPGHTDVADAYGVELLRIYDHYRFRWALSGARGGAKAKGTKSGPKVKKPPKEPPMLDLTDGWTTDYFGGDALKTLDRERFCP